MRSRIAMGILAAGLVAGAAQPLMAHHSVSGVYDVTKKVTVKGTISKIEWINPHVFVHVDSKDAKGVPVTWQLETVPVSFLKRSGITKELLMGKPGEQVTVTLLPARDGSKLFGILSRVTYADGHEYKLGIEGTEDVNRDR